jgi:hypothetical protein
MRSRALVFGVLLVFCGAPSARQPEVRALAPLPAPSRAIADALEIGGPDRSQLLLHVVRTLYAMGAPGGETGPRTQLRRLLEAPAAGPGETVPLPLDAAIWRETILQRPVPTESIVASIIQDRPASLLYHGLAGLDDETLAWLGPERDTLQHLLRHPGAFAIFGPSIRVRGGKIVVPGGPDLEPAWHSVIGADPARPSQFVKRLFSDENGQLAWFYDAVAQLDDASLKFAMGGAIAATARGDRMRALLDVFRDAGTERKLEIQPFTRRAFDPALTLAVIRVHQDGTVVGPAARGLWERLFEDQDKDFGSTPVAAGGDATPIDAVWLLARFHRVPIDIGRRRLDTFLFAQRVFDSAARVTDPAIVGALRGYQSFPSLMLTLERAGVRSPALLHAAAVRADALGRIGDERRQVAALMQFQSAIAILDRISRSRGLPSERIGTLVASLCAVEHTGPGYDSRFASWIKNDLAPVLTSTTDDTDLLEGALLAAMAGVVADQPRIIEWEGRSYRVSAARGEASRLQRIRQRQGGRRLSQAMALFDRAAEKRAPDRGMVLAETLASIVYAAYLGDPEGPALNAGNVALRHDFGIRAPGGVRAAWRLPSEGHGSRGWRVSGSLLGLDVALSRMALRRLDFNEMPLEPKLVSAERQTAALSVALLSPSSLHNTERDEIAAALRRGRSRLAALDGSRDAIEQAAQEAGLSAWRREALAWTVVHDRDALPTLLSPVETMWLGKPIATAALDTWGAATFPLSGCLCLAMPRPRPWEPLSGRPSLGLLATRGADVAILVADALAAAKLPAELAPGVIAFAMQEVMDNARPSYMDDWTEFTRAAFAIPHEAFADFIAAQTAGGGLLPAKDAEDRQH